MKRVHWNKDYKKREKKMLDATEMKKSAVAIIMQLVFLAVITIFIRNISKTGTLITYLEVMGISAVLYLLSTVLAKIMFMIFNRQLYGYIKERMKENG